MRLNPSVARWLTGVFCALTGAWLLAAGAPPRGDLDLFDGRDPLAFDLAAPFDDLFARADREPDTKVDARLSYLDAASGQRVQIDGVEVSVRGNTSRRSTECAFPKLKLHLPKGSAADQPLLRGVRNLKIGTHCDDRPDGELTFQFGRWANEKSPLREGLVYRLLETADVAVPRTRLAQITYVFERARNSPQGDEPRSITRHALLLEDDADSFARVGAAGELIVPGGEPATGDRAAGTFDNARRQFSATDSARVAFAQAMIGNFDWALKFFPGDGYRLDGRKGLWNVIALARRDGTAFPMLYDFDLSGIVTGKHRWYSDVFPQQFAHARSQPAVEVFAQIQRSRSLFDRRVLDEMRTAFRARQGALMSAVRDFPVDAGGRANAEAYLGAFFDAIGTDEIFYGPVVARTDVVPFAGGDGTQPTCSPKDRVPIGTPVTAPGERSGTLARVALLDVFWYWAGKCEAVRQGPVWIHDSAIERSYPSK